MLRAFAKVLASLEVREPILLAVSGGVDSMVMANLFLQTGKEFSVAHCNFHLRGEQSDGDALFVEQWAKNRGIAVFRADFNTDEYARSRGVSIEMAARELRYSWFAEVCRLRGFKSLAVAHNLNDNAETMILNLLRGTGVKGMTGMKACSPLPGAEGVSLIRPLLNFPREDIHEYACSQSIEWREDCTNADSSYKRNCVRNEIFPLFRKLNPSFLKTLSEDAGRFAQAEAIADEYFEKAAGEVSDLSPSGGRVRIGNLLSKPHWNYLLFRMLSQYGFSSSVISDFGTLLKEGAVSGKTFFSSEYSAVTSSSEIIVSRLDSAPGASESVEVSGEGEYSIGGQSFMVEVVPVSELPVISGRGFRIRPEEGSIFIDAEALPFPFTVRRWKEGDWIVPFGMSGRKKLSDLFVDLGFSIPDKKRALVIADEGSHVLALLGHRIDDSLRLNRDSAKAVKIYLMS